MKKQCYLRRIERIVLFIFFLLFIRVGHALAQSLPNEIAIVCQNEPMKLVLNKIEQKRVSRKTQLHPSLLMHIIS